MISVFHSENVYLLLLHPSAYIFYFYLSVKFVISNCLYPHRFIDAVPHSVFCCGVMLIIIIWMPGSTSTFSRIRLRTDDSQLSGAELRCILIAASVPGNNNQCFVSAFVASCLQNPPTTNPSTLCSELKCRKIILLYILHRLSTCKSKPRNLE